MRVLIVLLVLVTGENKINSYSDQLKLGQVCKFGVEFDKNRKTSTKFVHRCVSLPNLKKGEKFQKFENFMKSFEMFKSLRNLESPQIH